MNTLFSETEFTSDTIETHTIRLKVEKFTRRISRSHLISNPYFSASNTGRALDIDGFSASSGDNSPVAKTEQPHIAAQERTILLTDFANSEP